MEKLYKQQKLSANNKISINTQFRQNYPQKQKMQFKPGATTIQRARTLYKQTQNDINNDRLKKITQDRMKKRYQYLAKEVERKQNQNDKQDIQQLKFYRNKFHSLTIMINQSMRESYNKVRFQNQVKTILKDNWQNSKSNNKSGNNINYSSQNNNNNENPYKNKSLYLDNNKKNDLNQYKYTNSTYVNNNDIKQITFNNNKNKPTSMIHHSQQRVNVFEGSSEDQYGYERPQKNIKTTKSKIVKPPIQQPKRYPPAEVEDNKVVRKSKSPLQQFFEFNLSKSKSKKPLTFQSVVPKSQMENSKVLHDLRTMNKRPSKSPLKEKSLLKSQLKNDSRVRDLRRQNQQLQKILRKRQKQSMGHDNKQTVQQLQKQIYYFTKVNTQLRQQTDGYPLKSQMGISNPYSISYRRNDVDIIRNKNIKYNTFSQAQDNYQKSKSRTKMNQSKKSNQYTEQKSIKSNASSKVQRQKQMYINRTPQVLFENELIKVMIIRYPLKIEQKLFSTSSSRLNPEDICPNEQKLQLLVLNNAKSYVKNEQLSIKVHFQHDKRYHSIQTHRNQNRGYSHKAQTMKDIVYSQIIRIKLMSSEGYNQQVKAFIKADFFYNSQISTKKNKMEQIIDKKQNKFQIQIKLPVTFLQFSNKQFSGRQYNSKKIKLTVKANELYDNFQHTYMNTNLPLKKVHQTKSIRQQASMWGKSFVHDKNRNGTYLQSEIIFSWGQKRNQKYISVYAIEQWAYLLSYMFLDVTDEEEEFDRQFRKPSTHVYFNLDDKQYI